MNNLVESPAVQWTADFLNSEDQQKRITCWFAMLFNSYVFVFAFLPATLAAFLVLGRLFGMGWAITSLVLASLVYYGWWNPVYVGLIGFSILFNYLLGLAVSPDERRPRRRGWLLAFGIAVNLGLLGYFKYANFFVDSANAISDLGWELGPIVLPLAISFFTFQQIAYLVDSYRNETYEHRFVDYCLFVSFFPQLIAGPIVHHKEMLSQFAKRNILRFRPADISIGSSIFAIGLFKKVILADTVAVFATPIFDGISLAQPPTTVEAWIGALAYTMQLYFDFSGYSDMAVGLGRLFGIRLPINFNSPYKARNIADFWRRWHITLSRFLRDYLYIPLGGNRKGESRRLVNLMTTMILGGLWHGAGWTFVAWGGLHGLYLVVHRVWKWMTRGASLPAPLRPLGIVAALLVTQLAVIVGWVFFRATSFDAASAMLKGMVGLGAPGVGSRVGLAQPGALLVVLGAIAVLCPNTIEIFAVVKPVVDMKENGIRPPRWRLLHFRPNLVWACFTGALFVFAVLGMSRVTEFLYFQF